MSPDEMRDAMKEIEHNVLHDPLAALSAGDIMQDLYDLKVLAFKDEVTIEDMFPDEGR